MRDDKLGGRCDEWIDGERGKRRRTLSNVKGGEREGQGERKKKKKRKKEREREDNNT